MTDSPGDGQERHAISCINCRTRKVKCNKVYPCGPCQKLQVECLFRAKKARPKKSMVSKARSNDINTRLDRLDQLVSKLGTLQGNLPQDVQSLLTGIPPEEQSRPEVGPGTGKPPEEPHFGPGIRFPMMRSEFWMNLSDEVEGLRHTLCPSPEDDDLSDTSEEEETMPPGPGTEWNQAAAPLTTVFGGNSMSMQGRRHPSAAEVLRLTEIFFERVVVLFRHVHTPTVRKLIGRVVAEGTKPILTKAESALLFSMYFAAVNTMDDAEYALLQQDRRSALMYYKNCTEAALAEANLLCCSDLVTLQAFVNYLLALRSIDHSQSCWSLVGLAIRLATAMDMHREISCTRIPPYDVQMRRRVYWQLCLLDIQSFQDRGLSPMLQFHGQSFPALPANVDDADFGPETKEPVSSRIGMTEMTTCLISPTISLTALNMASIMTNTTEPDTTKSEQMLRTLHDKLVESFKYFDMSKPLCWFSKLVTRIALLKIWLLTHIPVHVRMRKARPQVSKEEVLACCITLMELHHEVQTKEHMKRFAWYHRNWHQWHPLAVALAELITTPTGPLADRAWLSVNESFHTWKKTVADGKRGALWRQIRKLHDRARKARAQALGVSADTPNSDGSSPTMDTGSAKSILEQGEQRHYLHDAAIRRATNIRPGEDSLMLFLRPSENGAVEQFGGGIDATQPVIDDSPINWEDWNNFLTQTFEADLANPEVFDQTLMEGIMGMPFDMNPPQSQNLQTPDTMMRDLKMNNNMM